MRIPEMDDLISRQKLKDAMYQEAFEKDSNDQKWDSGCWIRYRMFERITDAQPSAERKKGRWEMKPDPYGFFGEIPVCSECGCTTKMRDKTKFCPHCGARMEESKG